MDSLNKIIVHHKSSHHAGYSGYAQLIKYLNNVEVIEGKPSLPYKLAKLIAQFQSADAGMYDSNSVYKQRELKNLLKDNTTATVVHFLNAERDIRRLPNAPHVSYTATFHKPPSILKQQITNTRYLKNLQGAICVGSNQVPFIKEWLGLEQVVYIPHGVDTHFFVPAEDKKSTNRPKLLFVGQHLRDFETFNKVIAVLLDKEPELWVDVILRKDYAPKILLHDRVAIHSGVDDVSLRAFYQSATLLFLPLLDSTACNSILEAMACGLPIVTTDVGGVRTYLDGTANPIVPVGDIEGYLEAIQRMILNQGQLQQISMINREKSVDLDWAMVANKVELFYKALC